MRIDCPTHEETPQLWALWKEAFHDEDDFISSFQKAAFSPERCRCVFKDNEIISMLFWFDCEYRGEKIAYLYAVATKEKFQNQGFCRILMDDTHQHLKSLDYSAALLVPGNSSLFSYYEKLGYRLASYIGEISSSSSEKEIHLRKISSNEYALLRRKFLPKNTVIQENENLAFLETMADFYAADNFLVAGRKNKNEFVGIELLGDENKAGQFLSELQCTRGKFRVAKKENPFSMYYPLKDGFLAPEYFGLAFD